MSGAVGATSRHLDECVAAIRTASELAEGLCRRKGLAGAEMEDFISWMKIRLITNDYRILRQFRGDSCLRTFLSVVVANLMRDYMDKIWGKWRSSAAAERMGPLAQALEVAVHRDGLSLREAAGRVRAKGFPELTDRQAAEILAALPVRARPHFEGIEALERVPGAARADRDVLAKERASKVRAALDAVDAALNEIPHQDRTIIEMRYREGLTVAEVARRLGLEQKPLYRRIERIRTALRASPLLADVRPEAVLE